MQLASEPEQSFPFEYVEHLQKGINCDDNLLKTEIVKDENTDKSDELADIDAVISVDKPGSYVHSKLDVLTVGTGNVKKLVPCSVPLLQLEIDRKETEVYADEAVTDLEQPKMIVCYKEGSYHIIKDICVDEGLHIVQNVVKDEKARGDPKFGINNFTGNDTSDRVKSTPNALDISSFNNEITEDTPFGSVSEQCGDIIHSTDDVNLSGSKETKFVVAFPPQGSDAHQSEEWIASIHDTKTVQRSLASLLEEDRGNIDATKLAEPASEINELIMDDMEEELYSNCCDPDFLSCQSSINQLPLVDDGTVQQGSLGNNSEELQSNQDDFCSLIPVSGDHPNLESISENNAEMVSVHCSSRVHQVGQGKLEESSPIASALSFEVLKEDRNAKCLPASSDSGGNIVAFDSNNIVAFDSNYEPLDTIFKMDTVGMSESQLPGPVTSSSTMETPSDGLTSSSRPSFSLCQVDENVPGQASLSGCIMYSGPVPYSGSISLRSDSSTTSTRSFAFPILQSEWNSSPVRMAKADRRHFRRRRGWRSGLLCCRF